MDKKKDDYLGHIRENIIRWSSGSFSSVVGVTLTYPIERIKTIIQTQDSLDVIQSGKIKPFTGVIDVCKRLFKEQGLKSFWRGNSLIVYRYIPQQGLNFAFYHSFRNVFYNYTNFPNIIKLLLAGASAGTSTNTILYPLWYCQIRISTDFGSSLQEHVREREFIGFLQCIRKIYRTVGWRGLYSGFVPATLHTALMRACFFGLFDLNKNYLAARYYDNKPEIIPIYVLYPAGQISTIIASVSSYPLDTVATRLMLQTGKPKNLRQFNGTWHCVKELYRTGGYKIFFKGVLINQFRTLGGGIALVLNDKIIGKALGVND